MASKTVPAKKKPTTATDKSTDTQEAITTARKFTSKNLQGTATLTPIWYTP